MENETQTLKSLDIIEIVKKIHSNQPLPSVIYPSASKSVFPYIEVYNAKKKKKESQPLFLHNYHRKLFNLNSKIKEKEFAHFHGLTTSKCQDSYNSILSSDITSISSRRSKYLNSKKPSVVSKSFDYNNQTKKKNSVSNNFRDLVVMGLNKVGVLNEKELENRFKLPSLHEVMKSNKLSN